MAPAIEVVDPWDGRPIVVEVLGIAGSGKTTLGHQLAAADGVEIMSRVRRRGNFIPYLATASRLAPRFGSMYFSGSRSWRGWNTMMRLGSAPAIVRQQARRGTRVLIFVQGPVFLVERLSKRGEKGISPTVQIAWREWMLARWGPILDLLVIVDADDDVLIDRIRERTKPHEVKELPSAAAKRAFAEQRERFEVLVRELAAHGAPRIMRLDTTKMAPHEARDRVLETMKLLSPPALHGQSQS